MELTLQPSQTEEKEKNKPRLTTFTPKIMENTLAISNNRRRTLFTPSTDLLSTPYSSNQNKTLVFNSQNRISSIARRSVFEISMNILDLNCKAISSQNKAADDDDVIEVEPVKKAAIINSVKKINVPVETPPGLPIVRKRKLFSAEEMEDFNFKTTSKFGSSSTRFFVGDDDKRADADRCDNKTLDENAARTKKMKICSVLRQR
jgi:hypothetical protein